VERVFRGDVKSLIAAFAKPEKLSADDLKEIREMIDALERKEGKR
jgi:predicted transcriptional regulator